MRPNSASNRLARLGLTPQHVHLHFHCNQRLHRSIVQFARKARPLGRPRPPPQPVQQVNVVDRRTHLVNQIQQESAAPLASRPATTGLNRNIRPLHSPPNRNETVTSESNDCTLAAVAEMDARFVDRHLVADLIQRQCRPTVPIDRRVTHFPGKIVQIGFRISRTRTPASETPTVARPFALFNSPTKTRWLCDSCEATTARDAPYIDIAS